MYIPVETLKSQLIALELVTAERFDELVVLAQETKQDVEQYVVSERIISDDELAKIVANVRGWHVCDIARERIDDALFLSFPEESAKAHQTVLLREENGVVVVATLTPDNTELQSMLEQHVGKPVDMRFTAPSALATAFRRYTPGLTERWEQLSHQLREDATDKERDAAVVALIDLIMSSAADSSASDVHFNPERSGTKVRFRIDGILHDMIVLPPAVYESVVSRIKILSKMRTDEHRSAQDGKFRFTFSSAVGDDMDVRVSIVPSTYGETAVLRLLTSSHRNFSLSDLGFGDVDMERFKEAIQKPHGMVLVTGPTGSGKTTTLYGALKIINTPDVNIATIEDPVEYEMGGITQIQVNVQSNVTFASGLRAIVRQDPDIIMVGEIRDEETANIAINSALTGHLVLSTLHTNDAPTALPRLIDMGVEPFLVASTIHIVVAQRLVRKICQSCVESYTATPKEMALLKNNASFAAALKVHGGRVSKTLRLYRGGGCRVCNNTGYAGRIGIFETMMMTESIRSLVMQHANADDVRTMARKEGMATMQEDGFEKVLNGLTTLEEIFRATTE
jgi:type IV pilus assembly protein PilB